MKFKLKKNIVIECINSIELVEPNIWNQFVAEDEFYKRYEFIQIIASTQKDIQHRFVKLFLNDKLIGFLYFQQFNINGKDIFNFIDENNVSSWKNVLKRKYENKPINILNLGNIFFTGDNGILTEHEATIYPLLNKIFKCVSKSFAYKIHGFVIGDASETLTENSCGFSFQQYDTEPDMLLNIKDNWHCFDDYLSDLSSKYRVRTKKVLKESKDIVTRDFDCNDIIQYKSEIKALYNNVMQQTKFKLATIDTNIYENINNLYDDKFAFKAYFLNDKLVGFAAIFLCLSDTMHVHYIGLDYEINQEYKLYNRMLFDFVQLAIDKKYKKIHFGRTATEIKSTIGAKPVTLNAFVKLNSWINIFLKFAYKPNKVSEYIIRHPFKYH